LEQLRGKWREVLGEARFLGEAESALVDGSQWNRLLAVEPVVRHSAEEVKLASPRVLISYSHDEPETTERVFQLAKKLRSHGIDAWIDQFEPNAQLSWPVWMRGELKRAQFVLMLFTPGYVKKMETTQRSGVRYETFLIIQNLYQSAMVNDKFIPIVWSPADEQHIVDDFRAYSWFAVDTDAGYEGLMRRLLDDPVVVVPALGTPKKMGPIRQ
jgi:hypothetical protein